MGFPAIWMNGRITDAADARVSIFDHGLLYGDGVFEGHSLLRRAPVPPRRAPRAPRAIGRGDRARPPLPARRRCARRSRPSSTAPAAPDGYLRAPRDPGRRRPRARSAIVQAADDVVVAAPLRVFDDPPDAGVAVIVASTRQAPADVVDARIKSLNYLNRLLARLEAIRAGADEAFMLNARGTSPRARPTTCSSSATACCSRRRRATARSRGSPREVVLALAKEPRHPGARDLARDLRPARRRRGLPRGHGRGARARSAASTAARSPRVRGRLFQRIRGAFDALVRRETVGRVDGPRLTARATRRARDRRALASSATIPIAARSSPGVQRENARRAPWAGPPVCARRGATGPRLSGTKSTPRSPAPGAQLARVELAPLRPERQSAVGEAARDVAARSTRPLDGAERRVAPLAVGLPRAAQVALEPAVLDPGGDGGLGDAVVAARPHPAKADEALDRRAPSAATKPMRMPGAIAFESVDT